MVGVVAAQSPGRSPVLRKLDIVAIVVILGLFSLCWLFGEYLDGRLRDGLAVSVFGLIYPPPPEPLARPTPPAPAPIAQAVPAAPAAPAPMPQAPAIPEAAPAVPVVAAVKPVPTPAPKPPVPKPPAAAAAPAAASPAPAAPEAVRPARPAPASQTAAATAQRPGTGHTLINKDRQEYTVRVQKADGSVEVLVVKPLESRHIDQDCKLELVGKGATSALQGNLTVYIKDGNFSFI